MVGSLTSLAQSVGITKVGWFEAGDFPGYIEAIEARPEYHRMAYRTRDAFLKAGHIQDGIRTVIVLVMDYFYEKCPAGGLKLSNYSRFCWQTLEPKANQVVEHLKAQGLRAEKLDLPNRAAACRAGLGFIGKNSLFYAHGAGSYVGIRCIGTDLRLTQAAPGEEQVGHPVCKSCNKCVEACPTQAIHPEGHRINPLKCVSFLNRHAEEPHKEPPEDLSRLNGWLYGCEVCQDVCPLNVKVHHEKKVTLAPEIVLHGMRLPNKSCIPAELLRDRLKDIKLPQYKDYVERLLGAP
jgi:epoxyqueuosine reductase QueG